jgi:hypothetical protein
MNDTVGSEPSHSSVKVWRAENKNVQSLESRECVGDTHCRLRDAVHEPIEGLRRCLQGNEGGLGANHVSVTVIHDRDQLNETAAEVDVSVPGPECAEGFARTWPESWKGWRRYRESDPSIERERRIDIAYDVADMV